MTKIVCDAHSMGFSNRTWDETIRTLAVFGIQRLVDIRTLPGSKHTPQFNLEHLKQTLPRAGIEYIHMKSLGGLRKPVKDSMLNAAWRNSGFRGFADYMQTPQFDAALAELIRLIEGSRTVFCCTEAVFWRCHRQLVSDALCIRGYSVKHIFSASKIEEHKLTKFVKADGTHLTYPNLL